MRMRMRDRMCKQCNHQEEHLETGLLLDQDIITCPACGATAYTFIFKAPKVDTFNTMTSMQAFERERENSNAFNIQDIRL